MYLSNQEIWVTLLGNLGISLNDILKQATYINYFMYWLAMHCAVLHSYMHGLLLAIMANYRL